MLDVFKQLLHDGSKELAQNDLDSSKYAISSENKVVHYYHLFHALIRLVNKS